MKKFLVLLFVLASCQDNSNDLKNQNDLSNNSIHLALDSLEYMFVKQAIFEITDRNVGNCPPESMIRKYTNLSEKIGKDSLIEKVIEICK